MIAPFLAQEIISPHMKFPNPFRKKVINSSEHGTATSPCPPGATPSANCSPQQGGAALNIPCSYHQPNFSGITFDYPKICAIYETSSMFGRIIDTYVSDMTREGINLKADAIYSLEDIQAIEKAMRDINLTETLQEALRWAIVFGGSAIVIDDNLSSWSEPLEKAYASRDIKDIQLKVYDRWRIMPQIRPTIANESPISWSIIQPDYLSIVSLTDGSRRLETSPQYDKHKNELTQIDASRVLKVRGLIRSPWIIRQQNMGWDSSILERLLQQLYGHEEAIFQTTYLLRRANTRTLKKKGLNDSLAALAGNYMDIGSLEERLNQIAICENNMSMTLVDGEDEVSRDSYTFTGLYEIIDSFRYELTTAAAIPYTRLIGAQLRGLGTIGDADLQNYYDGIRVKQQQMMREVYIAVLTFICRVLFRRNVIPEFDFATLWSTDVEQEASVADKKGSLIVNAYTAGITSQKTALQELKNLSAEANMFMSISEEDIENADDTPPTPSIGEQEEDGIQDTTPKQEPEDK